MTRPSRWPFFLFLLGVFLLSSGVLFAQSIGLTHEQQADAFHKQAVDAYGKGNLDEAVPLWVAAERLVPEWKYSFNLATAYRDLKEHEESVNACKRARKNGMPDKHLHLVDKLQKQQQTLLQATHAHISLTINPENATVFRNGKEWPAPRTKWTKDVESTIEVKADGYKTETRVYQHDHGKDIEREISLAKVSTIGSLVVSGAPAKAGVDINGERVGRLPEYTDQAYPVGNFQVRVYKKGYTAFTATGEVLPDQTTSFEVSLEKIADPSSMEAYMPWVVVGSGAAIVAAGAVFTYLAIDTHDTQASLSTDLGPAEGNKRFKDLGEEIESHQMTSYILYGIGGAAIAGGLVWYFLPKAPEQPTSAESSGILKPDSMYITPTPAGGFAAASWRF